MSSKKGRPTHDRPEDEFLLATKHEKELKKLKRGKVKKKDRGDRPELFNPEKVDMNQFYEDLEVENWQEEGEKASVDDVPGSRFHFPTPRSRLEELDRTTKTLDKIKDKVERTIESFYELPDTAEIAYEVAATGTNADMWDMPAGRDGADFVIKSAKGRLNVIILDYEKMCTNREELLESLREWMDNSLENNTREQVVAFSEDVKFDRLIQTTSERQKTLKEIQQKMSTIYGSQVENSLRVAEKSQSINLAKIEDLRSMLRTATDLNQNLATSLDEKDELVRELTTKVEHMKQLVREKNSELEARSFRDISSIGSALEKQQADAAHDDSALAQQIADDLRKAEGADDSAAVTVYKRTIHQLHHRLAESRKATSTIKRFYEKEIANLEGDVLLAKSRASAILLTPEQIEFLYKEHEEALVALKEDYEKKLKEIQAKQKQELRKLKMKHVRSLEMAQHQLADALTANGEEAAARLHDELQQLQEHERLSMEHLQKQYEAEATKLKQSNHAMWAVHMAAHERRMREKIQQAREEGAVHALQFKEAEEELERTVGKALNLDSTTNSGFGDSGGTDSPRYEIDMDAEAADEIKHKERQITTLKMMNSASRSSMSDLKKAAMYTEGQLRTIMRERDALSAKVESLERVRRREAAVYEERISELTENHADEIGDMVDTIHETSRAMQVVTQSLTGGAGGAADNVTALAVAQLADNVAKLQDESHHLEDSSNNLPPPAAMMRRRSSTDMPHNPINVDNVKMFVEREKYRVQMEVMEEKYKEERSELMRQMKMLMANRRDVVAENEALKNVRIRGMTPEELERLVATLEVRIKELQEYAREQSEEFEARLNAVKGDRDRKAEALLNLVTTIDTSLSPSKKGGGGRRGSNKSGGTAGGADAAGGSVASDTSGGERRDKSVKGGSDGGRGDDNGTAVSGEYGGEDDSGDELSDVEAAPILEFAAQVRDAVEHITTASTAFEIETADKELEDAEHKLEAIDPALLEARHLPSRGTIGHSLSSVRVANVSTGHHTVALDGLRRNTEQSERILVEQVSALRQDKVELEAALSASQADMAMLAAAGEKAPPALAAVVKDLQKKNSRLEREIASVKAKLVRTEGTLQSFVGNIGPALKDESAFDADDTIDILKDKLTHTITRAELAEARLSELKLHCGRLEGRVTDLSNQLDKARSDFRTSLLESAYAPEDESEASEAADHLGVLGGADHDRHGSVSSGRRGSVSSRRSSVDGGRRRSISGNQVDVLLEDQAVLSKKYHDANAEAQELRMALVKATDEIDALVKAQEKVESRSAVAKLQNAKLTRDVERLKAENESMRVAAMTTSTVVNDYLASADEQHTESSAKIAKIEAANAKRSKEYAARIHKLTLDADKRERSLKARFRAELSELAERYEGEIATALEALERGVSDDEKFEAIRHLLSVREELTGKAAHVEIEASNDAAVAEAKQEAADAAHEARVTASHVVSLYNHINYVVSTVEGHIMTLGFADSDALERREARLAAAVAAEKDSARGPGGGKSNANLSSSLASIVSEVTEEEPEVMEAEGVALLDELYVFMRSMVDKCNERLNAATAVADELKDQVRTQSSALAKAEATVAKLETTAAAKARAEMRIAVAEQTAAATTVPTAVVDGIRDELTKAQATIRRLKARNKTLAEDLAFLDSQAIAADDAAEAAAYGGDGGGGGLLLSSTPPVGGLSRSRLGPSSVSVEEVDGLRATIAKLKARLREYEIRDAKQALTDMYSPNKSVATIQAGGIVDASHISIGGGPNITNVGDSLEASLAGGADPVATSVVSPARANLGMPVLPAALGARAAALSASSANYAVERRVVVEDMSRVKTFLTETEAELKSRGAWTPSLAAAMEPFAAKEAALKERAAAANFGKIRAHILAKSIEGDLDDLKAEFGGNDRVAGALVRIVLNHRASVDKWEERKRDILVDRASNLEAAMTAAQQTVDPHILELVLSREAERKVYTRPAHKPRGFQIGVWSHDAARAHAERLAPLQKDADLVFQAGLAGFAIKPPVPPLRTTPRPAVPSLPLPSSPRSDDGRGGANDSLERNESFSWMPSLPAISPGAGGSAGGSGGAGGGSGVGAGAGSSPLSSSTPGSHAQYPRRSSPSPSPGLSASVPRRPLAASPARSPGLSAPPGSPLGRTGVVSPVTGNRRGVGGGVGSAGLGSAGTSPAVKSPFFQSVERSRGST